MTQVSVADGPFMNESSCKCTKLLCRFIKSVYAVRLPCKIELIKLQGEVTLSEWTVHKNFISVGHFCFGFRSFMVTIRDSMDPLQWTFTVASDSVSSRQ
jgi:hypothetical protein